MRKREGFILIDTLVSLVLISCLIIIIFKFNNYAFDVIKENKQELYELQTINNKIVELYEKQEWGLLIDEELHYNSVNMYLDYTYYEETIYKTEKLVVQFQGMNDIKEYSLERNK